MRIEKATQRKQERARKSKRQAETEMRRGKDGVVRSDKKKHDKRQGEIQDEKRMKERGWEC